tara:strand:+ start:1375 stop:1749 length:375 start_codon:yes stop_codon:yes gene_type:complete
MGNPQKYFVKATYDHTDGQSQGDVTLAVTDNVPKGATITDVIIEKVENITSGGAALTTITAGGVTITGNIALGSLAGGAGYVTDANVGRLYIDTTSNAPIGINIADADYNGSSGKFNITVGYLL